jgi:hypothetical protein
MMCLTRGKKVFVVYYPSVEALALLLDTDLWLISASFYSFGTAIQRLALIGGKMTTLEDLRLHLASVRRGRR